MAVISETLGHCVLLIMKQKHFRLARKIYVNTFHNIALLKITAFFLHLT
jgi:hypothetical protein